MFFIKPIFYQECFISFYFVKPLSVISLASVHFKHLFGKLCNFPVKYYTILFKCTFYLILLRLISKDVLTYNVQYSRLCWILQKCVDSLNGIRWIDGKSSQRFGSVYYLIYSKWVIKYLTVYNDYLIIMIIDGKLQNNQRWKFNVQSKRKNFFYIFQLYGFVLL